MKSIQIPKAQIFLLEYEKNDIEKIFKDKLDVLLKNVGSRYNFNNLYDFFEDELKRNKKDLFLTDFPIAGSLVINFFSKLKKFLERPGNYLLPNELERYVINGAWLLIFSTFYNKFPSYMKVFDDIQEYDGRKKEFIEKIKFFDRATLDWIIDDSNSDYLSQLFKLAKKGILDYTVKRHLKPIYVEDSGEISVYSVNTYRQCRALGADTRWCTASSSGQQSINIYLERGKLFIIFRHNEKFHLFLSDELLNNKLQREYDIYFLIFKHILNNIKSFNRSGGLITFLRMLSDPKVFQSSIEEDTKRLRGMLYKLVNDFEEFSDEMEHLIRFYNNETSRKEAVRYIENIFIPNGREVNAPIYEIFSNRSLKYYFWDWIDDQFSSSVGLNLYFMIILYSLLFTFFGEEMVKFPKWNTTKSRFVYVFRSNLVRLYDSYFLFELKDDDNHVVSLSDAISCFDLMAKALPEYSSTMSSISRLFSNYEDKNEIDYIKVFFEQFEVTLPLIENVVYRIFQESNVFDGVRAFADKDNVYLKAVLEQMMEDKLNTINDYFDFIEKHSGNKIEELLNEIVEKINSMGDYERGLIRRYLKVYQENVFTKIHLIDRLYNKIKPGKEKAVGYEG